MFKTGAQMMILVLVAGLVLMRESRQEPLTSWDDRWVDFLATTSHRKLPEAPITLVRIDDSSLQEHPWPWNPLDFSLFFQAILPHEPSVLAIDQVLDWNRMALPEAQAKKLPQYEKILLDNVLRAPRMLLGSQLGFPDDPQVAPVWQEVPLLRHVQGDVATIPEYTIVESQPPEEYRLASTMGFINLPALEGTQNSVPLLLRHHGQIVPTFPLQALMLWAKLTPDEVSVEIGSHIDVGHKRRIPIDARGRLRVDFGVPCGQVSFEDLLLATEQTAAKQKPVANLDPIKGRIALLSRTDHAASTISFATRRTGSAGELFAAAIATMQSESYIERAPFWSELAVLAVVMLLALFIPGWKRWRAIGVAVALLAAYTLGSMAVFNRWLIWLPGVMPVGTVLSLMILRLVASDRVPRPKKPIIL